MSDASCLTASQLGILFIVLDVSRKGLSKPLYFISSSDALQGPKLNKSQMLTDGDVDDIDCKRYRSQLMS